MAGKRQYSSEENEESAGDYSFYTPPTKYTKFKPHGSVKQEQASSSSSSTSGGESEDDDCGRVNEKSLAGEKRKLEIDEYQPPLKKTAPPNYSKFSMKMMVCLITIHM